MISEDRKFRQKAFWGLFPKTQGEKQNQISKDSSNQCHIFQHGAFFYFLRHLPTMRQKHNRNKSANILRLLHQVCRKSPQFIWNTCNLWCPCCKSKKIYSSLPRVVNCYWILIYTNITIAEPLSHLLENSFPWGEIHLHLDTFVTSSNYWLFQFVQVNFFKHKPPFLPFLTTYHVKNVFSFKLPKYSF